MQAGRRAPADARLDAGADLALQGRELLRRGLRPVVVLLDPASFGGVISAKELAMQIKTLGVPVRRVECGQDLAVALSTSA